MVPVSLYAQGDVKAVTDKIVSNIRSNKVEAIDTKIIYAPANEKKTLAVLQTYLGDSLSAVRDNMYHLVASVALKSTESSFRKEGTHVLVAGLSDKEPVVKNTIIHSLSLFKQGDFTEEIKKHLSNLLQESSHGCILQE